MKAPMEDSIDKFQDGVTKLAPRKYEIVYKTVLVFVYIHVAGVYGAYLAFTHAKWMTILFTYFTSLLAMIGVIVGAHRLWSHKAFKAKLPLQIFLMCCQSLAFQYSVFDWVRDHRLHHKHSDTDADPHNSKRGLFFSHMGWLMVKKHPDVLKLGSTINMEDIYSNQVLRFQKRHAYWLLPTLAFILPTIIPYFFWSEHLSTSWHVNQLRFLVNLHTAFSVNSFSHTWGHRPFDRTLTARQSLPIILVTLGEGFHNYHHAFPYDYKGGDRSSYGFNFMARFVDICARFGLAYDLREASEALVMKRRRETGDDSVMK